jgi:hypothetical protein
MMHHIDISSVLRQSVSQTYSHLVTRPTGAAVREYIERQLTSGAILGDVTVIDFSHVGMMDFSCADEIVAKLVLQHRDHSHQFVFSGLSESHIEAIDAVLERHGLSLVSHEADARTYVARGTH